MTAVRERNVIRVLHLVLSIPIVGYLYGPVASIPSAAWFTRWIAMPVVVLSGLWLWLKPRIVKLFRRLRAKPDNCEQATIIRPVSRKSLFVSESRRLDQFREMLPQSRSQDGTIF